MLEKLEVEARRLPVAGHALINQLGAQSSEEELGGKLGGALADRLRITRTEANRRIAEADDLGPRRALTGESLAPQLAATAAAQRQGLLGAGHVQEIRGFFRKLPAAVDLFTRQDAEADLARKATQYHPDELTKYGKVLMDDNPDGTLTDEDRARQRGIVVGNQEFDGMSPISSYLNPELRATIEAAWAKLAAPGMCNPEDETPVIDDAPPEAAVRRDTRSQPQRNHDGLLAGLRGLLMSGDLGAHNGLPASIIVTATLKDLEAGAGRALTGGGALLPMSDVTRMASHAHLFGHLRRRQTPGLVSHQTPRLPRTANHAVCQGPWLHQAGLRRTRLLD